jgi:hypothetical protein
MRCMGRFEGASPRSKARRTRGWTLPRRMVRRESSTGCVMRARGLGERGTTPGACAATRAPGMDEVSRELRQMRKLSLRIRVDRSRGEIAGVEGMNPGNAITSRSPNHTWLDRHYAYDSGCERLFRAYCQVRCAEHLPRSGPDLSSKQDTMLNSQGECGSGCKARFEAIQGESSYRLH